MKKIVLALCLAPTLALAGGYGHHGPKQLQGQLQGQAQLQGQHQGQGQLQGQQQKSVNKNLNLNAALSGAKAKAKAYSEGSESFSVAGDSNASADGLQNVTVGGDVYRPKRQSPGAPALTAFPSGPCTGASIGFSGGWISGAFGIAGTSLDDECTIRANVQMLQALYERTGNPEYLELINSLILSMDSVKDVIEEPREVQVVDKRVDEYERWRRQVDEYDWLRYHRK